MFLGLGGYREISCPTLHLCPRVPFPSLACSRPGPDASSATDCQGSQLDTQHVREPCGCEVGR